MGGEEANARQYGARMSRTCAFLSLALLPQLAAGADWLNCRKSGNNNIFMSFPDPHGKAWPTQFSFTDWGGDSTVFKGLELDGYVRVRVPLNRLNPWDAYEWLPGGRLRSILFTFPSLPPPFPKDAICIWQNFKR